MSAKTLEQKIIDDPEMLCFNCEWSEVWPASIEGPEEIVCKRRMYPDSERCLRHDIYREAVKAEEEAV